MRVAILLTFRPRIPYASSASSKPPSAMAGWPIPPFPRSLTINTRDGTGHWKLGKQASIRLGTYLAAIQLRQGTPLSRPKTNIEHSTNNFPLRPELIRLNRTSNPKIVSFKSSSRGTQTANSKIPFDQPIAKNLVAVALFARKTL